MIHASPFFESILTGEWAETSLNPEDDDDHQEQEEQDQDQTTTNHDKLDSGSEPDTHNHYHTNPIRFRSNTSVVNSTNKIEARIVLEEEHPAPFQDLLMFVYPHLECVCTWQNASDLMTMSQKFDMPLLKRHVLNFLLSSVAGKPIEAMKIAEENQLADLYRESSRFLLDNWQGWEHKELDKLSAKTLLKLEKRRTWFLERLLKLGLVNSSRDYVCPSSCPDPQHCTKLVDDKWRSAWAASFKFGPPQPSSVYRALRSLEPSLHSPALLLPHTSCQQHALRFFADLFDRMFSQFTPRGGGSSNNNNISHSASTSSATITTNTPTLDQQQQHNTPGPPGSGGPINNNLTSSTNNNPTTNTGTTMTTTTTPSTSTGFLHTSTSSSNFLNSDKSIRKAKYFLHVELFDSNEKSHLKRTD
ncbi:hypothetical protein KEM48_003994 [Puccinia striiformis f. sp. tritici PST-130]|nr:hypothetical protein Pst134EB_014814 [Puccinia striiformis f. sp. tritici]KAI9612918.1 hypothetical protein KEM48_003994 [Puccinia striiformis f. sp. tritici PST-130]